MLKIYLVFLCGYAKIDTSLGDGLQSLMRDGSFITLPVRSVDRNTLRRQNNKGFNFAQDKTYAKIAKVCKCQRAI